MSDKPYRLAVTADDVAAQTGSGYPAPYDEPCRTRVKTKLGDAVGLSQFGVNLVLLQPGAWSSQRHWHFNEDEFVYILDGEVVLVTDEGETVLKAGDVAGFPAGMPNGHHLINKSEGEVRYLEVGTRSRNETAVYSDIDMMVVLGAAGGRFQRKNGEPIE